MNKHLFKTPLTSNSSTQLEELGAVRREWNTTDACFKTYKYVKASMAVAGSNGVALSWYDVLGTVVTDDISTANQNQPAGVCTGTLTHTYYGWIQIGGYHSAVDTDAGDDFADGDSAILHASTNGVVDRTASGTAPVCKPIGIAVAADVDAADTVALQLCCAYGDIIQ